MLKMKAACERCRANLAPDGAAMICSFECTFCSACAAQMQQRCPNCGGELVRRPKREKSVLSAAAGQVLGRLRR
ncbi:DUF1272 domain-containing protein [Deinococcus xinjiangensis]|uniref:DUF1272 domain-containing protein n=1 Tax=Deinococcus xinjiangensis TaxID=457454 RepID=UPI00336593AD